MNHLVEVKNNTASVKEVCPWCHQMFKPDFGDWWFLKGTWTPVCEKCANKPALSDRMCPNCAGGNVGSFAGYEWLEENTVWGTGDCADCGAHWQLEYHLAAVDNITAPSAKTTMAKTLDIEPAENHL